MTTLRNISVAKNTLWSYLGQLIPLTIAIFAIPVLISSLGTERFSILTLAWALIGYFSLFDLGIGRALTYQLSRKLSEKKDEEATRVVWSSLSFLFVLGLIAAVILKLFIHGIVYTLLNIPEHLQAESFSAFNIILLVVPIVVVSAGLRGILHAYQRFDLATAAEIPMGLATFLGPLVVLPFSKNLLPLFCSLVISRVAIFIFYVYLCKILIPAAKKPIIIKLGELKELLKFGKWITVSNIVGPIMSSMDRFFLGALMPISNVAYYATPHQIITKLSIIPLSLSRALFPVFSSTYHINKENASFLFFKGIRYTLLVFFPIIFFILMFSNQILSIWLGEYFASQSYKALRWLCIGVFANSFGLISYSIIQGSNRPDLTAKLHLVELPFYMIVLFYLVRLYGVAGAALTWCLRTCVDALILFVLSQRILSIPTKKIVKILAVAGSINIVFIFSTIKKPLVLDLFFLTIVLVVFGGLAWKHLVNQKEKTRLLSFLKTKWYENIR